MDGYSGKICPFCGTEILEGDAVKVCPYCGAEHHAECWELNGGCATRGCYGQPSNAAAARSRRSGTGAAGQCANCGAPLSEGQDFCPYCGAPASPAQACPYCGAPLAAGQDFCPHCGASAGNRQRYGASAGYRQQPGAPRRKGRKGLIIGVSAGAVAVLALILALVLIPRGPKHDFNVMFADIAGEDWCEISQDGTWMTIDTNPYDLDDHLDFDAYYGLHDVLDELGFPSSVAEEMDSTRALDGRLSASTDEFEVSWTYHPDNGLEAMFEIIE